MTEIICKWLNDDVNLSKKIDPQTFAQDFSNGYLLGEILHKHGLQDDFDQFSQNKNSNSKLNNFMRLKPTINLLDITFNTNIAREIMQEKHSAITQLLYQMYISLTNKEKRNLTGATMETMRPAAPVKLEQFESKIYQKNLKAKTPRQTDLNLIMLRARYDKFKIEQEKIAFKTKFEEEENLKNEQQNKRAYLLNKSKEYRQQQVELFAKIKSRINNKQQDELEAAVIQVPKTPPKFKKEMIIERRKLFERNEGEKALKEIDSFEKRFKAKNVENDLSIVDLEEKREFDDDNEAQKQIDPINFLKPKSNDDYISKIRNRLQEDSHARKEREKRRRKVLVDQLKANEALEETKREETLIAHLLRQSQFERRLAVELLHARHEKDVIIENRIAKEKEILEKREKEFRDALDREKELARLAKLEYLEQSKKDKELHDLIAAERAENKYKKHYEACSEIVNLIFEFSCKVGEYRELTDDLIPPKLWRDWLNLYRAGKSLYAEERTSDETKEKGLKEIEKIFNSDFAQMDEEKLKLLDECDFNEYKDMVGEWEASEQLHIETPQAENKILGHIVKRLHDTCYPVQPGAPKPIFPVFPLKVILIGKPFAGKTSSLKTVGQVCDMNILNIEDLITDAIEEYRKNPDLTPPEEQVEEKPKSLNGPEIVSTVQAHATSHQALHKEPTEISFDDADTNSDSKTKKTKKQDILSNSINVSHSHPIVTAVPKVETTEVEKPVVINKLYSNYMIRQLGHIALESLNNGEPVRDEIIVHILAEKIRILPEDKGWIIDGFPSTYEQAKLLEKALSGYDEDNPVPPKPKRESILAPNPKPEPFKSKHKSAIDLIIHLDVSNEIILKRSAGRSYGTISHTMYHQQFKPPPEGAHTGLNRVETIEQVKDPSNEMEQIQHRITNFEENWEKIKNFYENYSNLVVLNAEKVDQKDLPNLIQNEIDLFVRLREKKKQDEIEHKKMVEILLKQKLEEEEQARIKKLADEAAAAAAQKALEAELAAKEALEAQSSPKSSAKGKKGGKDKSPKRTRSKSPKSGKSEKSSSPKGAKKSASPKGGKGKKGSKSSTPIPVPEPIAEQKQDEPTSPQPGSDEWVYSNEKLDQRVSKYLCDYWDLIELTYIDGSKFIFRKIRVEREQIIRYFFTIKTNFKEYLRRPDTKQEHLESFIKKYNNLSDDMRDDEEVKAELHQQIEDLNDELWKICDKKKEDSENERRIIMENGWLSDKIGILTNHYITLMQTEVDRFQDSARFLKDYYKCMINPMPEEAPREYQRLPLLDLRNPDEIPSQSDNTSSSEKSLESSSQSDGKHSPKSPREKSPRTRSPRARSPKSPKSKSPTSSKKGTQAAPVPAPNSNAIKKGKKTPDVDENGRKRIPLISRRPSSQDAKDNKKSKAKPKNPDDMSPLPPEDLDERLIFDAYKNANFFISSIINNEVAVWTADEAQKDPNLNEEAKGSKTGKNNKSAKSRSPSAKKKPESPKAKSKSPKGAKGKGKGKEEPAPVSTVVELSEEEKLKKNLKDKIKKEYLAALKKEENAFKTRIDLIKFIANKVIQELKSRADNSYKDMDDWLGAQFVREIDSIKNLCNYFKHCVENKQKIKHELILQQDEFIVEADVVILRTPTPPPRPEAIEIVTVEIFTIDSIRKMLNQFKLVAPEGLVAIKTFIDIFNDLILLNYGNEILPEQWSNLTQSQIESLARMLASGSEFVDWRHWLLAASMPWDYPTQTQLLNLLHEYKKADRNRSGYISKSVFLQIPLWFRLEKPSTPPDITKPHIFDRHIHLVNFWFDLFSSNVQNLNNSISFSSNIQNEEKLDYKTMLLYMSAVPDPYEGFLRALSVSQESPMPRIEPKIAMKVPAFNTPEFEQLKLKSATTETFPDDQKVSMDSIYRVFHHGERQRGDTHRFAQTEDPEDFMSYQRIATIFTEINDEPNPNTLYTKLISHPVLCEMISICTKFRAPDFRTIFILQSNQEENETQDRRTPNE